MTKATRPSSITCARCGDSKAVERSGPLPTYCSAACRASVKYEKSRRDGRYAETLAKARQKTREGQEAEARPCPYCAAPMTDRQRVQCGVPECRRRHAADWMAEWQRRYKEEAGHWYHRKYADQQREYDRMRRATGIHWRTRYPEAAASSDARRRSLVRQARTEEVFNPLEVHMRDAWTCRLCWQPIDEAAAWPDSLSPSIDHVIPLSRGGAHSMANVQSAHLGCNSSKGDGLMDDMVIAAARQALLS
ncbi:HNH endonuclease [Streptomyces sp. NPDC096310]|uniref:HNH endonuclease n=1 Tax=Streptomyces sp. NPDC096310 TaxID=3366082 RepID=UPI003802CD71